MTVLFYGATVGSPAGVPNPHWSGQIIEVVLLVHVV